MQIDCPGRVTSSIWHCSAPESLPGSPRTNKPIASFRAHQRRIQLASEAAYPTRDLGRHQTPLRWIALHVVNTCQQLIHYTATRVHCGRSQLAWASTQYMHGPTAIKNQLPQEGSHNTHGTSLEHSTQMIKKKLPLGSTGLLLHEATLPRPGF